MPWHEVLQWIAILAVAMVSMGVLNLVTDIQRRLGPDTGAPVPHDGLEFGTIAPLFSAQDKRNGRAVSLAEYERRPMILAFLSPKCRPCAELVPGLNQFARENPDLPVMVVALDGSGTDYGRELGREITVVSDSDGSIQQAYEVSRTPLIYLINGEGKVTNRTVSNNLLDLQDTLAGIGRPLGSGAWRPEDPPHEEGSTEGDNSIDRG